jgi:hypothetical protein
VCARTGPFHPKIPSEHLVLHEWGPGNWLSARRRIVVDSCVNWRTLSFPVRERAIVGAWWLLTEDQVILIVVAMLTGVTVTLSLASLGVDIFSVRSLL